MTAPAGSVNAWQCDECRAYLVAIHVVEGVTPMFLACRAIVDAGRGCGGRGTSLGYPSPPVPEKFLSAVEWEWTLPSTTERKRWRRENPEMLDHVNRGGLVLRPLSDAGRRLLEQTHNYRKDPPR